MLPDEEKTTMPSHYASQGPTHAEEQPHLSYKTHLCQSIHAIFSFVYPIPTTSPRNRSHTPGLRQHFSANRQALLFPFLSFPFQETLTFPPALSSRSDASARLRWRPKTYPRSSVYTAPLSCPSRSMKSLP